MFHRLPVPCFALCASLLLAPIFASSSRLNAQEPRADATRAPSLAVSGEGEASARPDHATVRLGAEAQAETAAQAQSQVNAIMQRATNAIRAAGIAERNIQTTGLQLSPVYERQRGGDESAPRVIAYRARNTIEVEIDNLTLVGQVVDAGVEAGANRIESVQFELRDDAAARALALQRAVAQARAKATVLANAAEVRLLNIEELNESGVNVIPPPRPFRDTMVMRAEATTPIQPGELRVQASVSLRYRIAPR